MGRLTAGYGASLAAGGVRDGADTVRLAAERAEREGPPADTLYAAFDETHLTALEARFVGALTDGGCTLHRIGFALPGLAPPPATVAGRFWPGDDGAVPAAAGPGAWLGAPMPPAEAKTAAGGGYRFLRGIGGQAEVRAVLRDVLERGLRWDQVEVAYVANDPYLALLHAEVEARERAAVDDERERLPATFAAGFPLRLTRTGQALRGLLDWIEGGRDGVVLVRLLQGGLLTFRGHPEADPHRAAHALLEGGVGLGPGAYRRALERVLVGLERQRAEAEGQGQTEKAERLDARMEAVRVDLAAVDAFASWFPAEARTPAAFCRALREAILRHGPLDFERVESKRGQGDPFTHDEFALDLTQRRLRTFAEQAPAVLGEAIPPVRAAGALRDALLGGFLNARAPRGGSLHVVPLSSAGLAGRPHLYVLGLDGTTAAPPVVEDAHLPDRDRERLDADGRVLPRAADGPAYRLWGFARVLGRIPPAGTVTLCARTHDVGSGEPLFPSSQLLRAAALAGRDLGAVVEPEDAEGLVPEGLLAAVSGDGAPAPTRVALHVAEVDLAARRCDRLGRRLGLARRYPAAYQGLRATRARAAADLTLHDGWLGTGSGAGGVDLFGGGTVSPSRLETLATCPHRYFLRYVLGIERPPEAPDAEAFVDPRERGTLLHGVFEAFGNWLIAQGRAARAEDETVLIDLADEKVSEVIRERGEPPAAVLDALRRDVRATARVFLANEVGAGGAVPHACEQAFGFDRPVEVRLGPYTLLLRGYVDRVDRLPDDTYEVSDFKTGGTYGYPDPAEPDAAAALAGGTKLQWALYAYALEDAFGWRVSHSGYRFPSEKAWGERRRFRVPDRAVVAEVIGRLARLAEDGFFPPAAGSACTFCDYARVCGDTKRRRAEMQAAVEAARGDGAHPLAAALEAWPYK